MSNDNDSRMNTFLGGSPLGVALRLIVLSIVVGVILAAIGLSPRELIELGQRFIQRIYDLGFDAFRWLFEYFLIGAVIVIPIWFIARLFRSR